MLISNYRAGIKNTIYLCISLILFFTIAVKALASDYEYKILDPKYNPRAEEVIEGTATQPVQDVASPSAKHGFDFGLFFSICALVTFPILIVTVTLKNFKKIFEEVPGVEKQEIGNIKIEKKLSSSNTGSRRSSSKNATNSIRPAVSILPPEKKLPQSAGNSINKYFSSPIEKIPNPMLLNTSVLTLDKGICLVEYNRKYSLIGYIGDEIFMLDQFNTIKGREIRSRLSETIQGKDRYIVRFGDYKALVEVSETDMKLLLEL